MNTAAMSLPAFVRKSIGSIAPGVLMIVAGSTAIVAPSVTRLAVTTCVGWLLLFTGLMHFVYAWHTGVTGAIICETLVGIACKLLGGYVLFHPLLGAARLALTLAVFLFAKAVLGFIEGLQLRPRRGSGWIVADGVITLILGTMMWRTWSFGTPWVVGALVGVSVWSSGMTRLMFPLATRESVVEVRLG